MFKSTNLLSFSKTSKKLALSLIAVSLWSLFSCQSSPNHQKETKKVLCLIFQEGRSSKDIGVKKVAFEKEVHRLGMEIKVCLIPGSAQFLDTLIHTQGVYDALILHGHMTPVSIDADPGDPMLNIGANSSLSASKGTVDITQDFLKKNQKLIAAFASQHLTPEANVLAFGCKSANNIVELDGEIYNVTSIAESLSHAFKGHNVIGSRHQIAIASDLREKNQPIYGKNFLCAALGTVFLDIKNLNLYFKEGEGERIEPLVYITMIRSKVAGGAGKYKEIELPSTQGVRPITAEDLPRFYYQN